LHIAFELTLGGIEWMRVSNSQISLESFLKSLKLKTLNTGN